MKPICATTQINHITIRKFSELTGYTEDAIRTKMRDGVWLKDVVWIKAPDGRVLIDLSGYGPDRRAGARLS